MEIRQILIVVSLFKNGNIEETTNYWGITILNCFYKILAGILAKRLREWLETDNKLGESKASFRA